MNINEMTMWSELNRKQTIPEHTKQALDRYVNQGIPPGSFLIEVLCNNLSGAFGRADDKNIANMFAIVKYVHNDVPAIAWGSPERIESWINRFKSKENEENEHE